MRLLTEDAVLLCEHDGKVTNRPSQAFVTIARRKILVENDPEGRGINLCPNIGLTIKPCTLTLQVDAGYSDLLHVEGKRVCLDTVTGLTDGTPPMTVKYYVSNPGQELVTEGT